jgi:hypothetical protein
MCQRDNPCLRWTQKTLAPTLLNISGHEKAISPSFMRFRSVLQKPEPDSQPLTFHNPSGTLINRRVSNGDDDLKDAISELQAALREHTQHLRKTLIEQLGGRKDLKHPAEGK